MVRFALFAACVLALASASPARADIVRKAQTGSITVTDAGGTPPVAGSPYPSTIQVSGLSNVLTDVTVKLNDVDHAYPDDIDLLLAGPNGEKVLLMSDAGGDIDLADTDITFSDVAAGALPDQGAIASGTYRPSDYSGGGDTFPGAPLPPYSSTLRDAFDGANPNGQWQLYAVDDAAGDGGAISGGWALTLTLGDYSSNTAPITISDGSSSPTPASLYPSTIVVNGDGFAQIKRATVRLFGLRHDDPGDVDIMLQAPTGQSITLMSDAGGNADVTSRFLRFDDDAPASLDDTTTLQSGSYKPTNLQGADVFPAPAPAQSGSTSLADFAGLDPRGQWKLWVVDDLGGGSGAIEGGWSLQLTLTSGVTFDATTLTANEGDGTKTLVVERPEGGGPATVHYDLPGPGTAKDVKPASGTLGFVSGQKKKTLPVTVFDDVGDEGTEYAQLKLTAVSGDVTTEAGGRYDYLRIDDNDITDVLGDFNGDGKADQAIGVPAEDLTGGADAGAVQVLYGGDEGLGATGDQRFTEDAAGVPDVAEAGDQFGAAVAASDFDGDGFGDLAIGTPGEDDAGITDMGRVTVLYGSANGLKTAGAQLLGQGSPGVPDDNEPGDRFGAALAAGNMGRTDRGDLAIGAPGEDLGAINGAGAVTVLYGGSGTGGVGTTGAQQWTQASTGVQQDPEAGDAFGSVLAVADFGWGAEGDLAVGVPAENTGRGVVQVLYGTTVPGLAAAGNDLFSQSTPGMGAGSIAEDGDGFGSSLATGIVYSDAAAELAVGAPGENVNGIADAGAAHLLSGVESSGLGTSGAHYHVQSDSDIGTGNGTADRFGAAVAIGDFGGASPHKSAGSQAGSPQFTGSGSGDDLAVGVPGESFGAVKGAGAVEVIYGESHEAFISNQQWHQDSADVADTNEAGDHFGAALAASDFSGGGRNGLAIGVPGEKLGTAAGAGGLAVLYGASFSGISAFGSQRWAQGSAGVLDTAESGDGFGSVLTP